MQISVGSPNIEGLFTGQQNLTVPSFQRSYSWTRTQVEQFLKDVFESAETQDSHFYGPVVLLKLPSDPKNLQIVDGQQRLTTVVMSLSVLRDLAADLKDRYLFTGTPQQVDVLGTVRNFLFLPPTFVEPRFTASYQIEQVFRSAVLSDPSETRQVLTVAGAGMSPADTRATRELRRAYLQIRDEIRSRLKGFEDEEDKKVFLLSLFSALTSAFEIHTMELADEDEAYILFETLNDRGLRLNPSDLLKTLTLREVKQHGNAQALNDALAQWDQMVGNLGEYEFSKFLRHYLLTVTSGPVQANKIYSLFKARIEAKRHHGAYKNLIELVEASEAYSKLLDEQQHPDPSIRASIIRMNMYSDTHRVLLLGIPRVGLSEETVRKLYRATEYLSYRWIAAGWNAQVLENFYQAMAHALAKDPSDKGAEKVFEQILDKAPSDFDLSAITSNDSMPLQTYALRRIEESFGGHLAWDSPITVEHLAPQTPGLNGVYWYGHVASQDEPDANGMVYDDYIRIWGNLTLLERKLNSSIRNAPWPKKVVGEPNSKFDGLSASTMNLNKTLVKASDWTLALITDRNTWLHGTVLELVGTNWAKTGKASVVKWVP